MGPHREGGSALPLESALLEAFWSETFKRSHLRWSAPSSRMQFGPVAPTPLAFPVARALQVSSSYLLPQSFLFRVAPPCPFTDAHVSLSSSRLSSPFLPLTPSTLYLNLLRTQVLHHSPSIPPATPPSPVSSPRPQPYHALEVSCACTSVHR